MKSLPIHRLDSEKGAFLIRPLLEQINKKTLDDQPHRHHFYEIIFVVSGEGQHVIDDRVIDLEVNTFYFIGLNQIHGFQYGKDLKGYLIRFDAHFLPVVKDHSDILSTYANNILIKNILSLPADQKDGFIALLDFIQEEYNSNSGSKLITIQNLMFALLNKLSELLQHNVRHYISLIDEPDKRIYNEFILTSNQYFKEQHSLAYYSNQLGVSNRRLSDICTKYAGKTGKAIIIEKIITEVKRYLKYSSLSIKQIAYVLHFDDPAYMSRLFKKQTKRSLTEYRTSNKK